MQRVHTSTYYYLCKSIPMLGGSWFLWRNSVRILSNKIRMVPVQIQIWFGFYELEPEATVLTGQTRYRQKHWSIP